MKLVRALVTLEGPFRPKLWLVTRGVHSIREFAGTTTATGPDRSRRRSAIRGAFLVAGARDLVGNRSFAGRGVPGVLGWLIDLDPDSSGDEASSLVEEFIHSDGEDRVSFRRGSRFVSRLARTEAQPGVQGVIPVRPEGTYVITGGLGALGLRTARWLVERGAPGLSSWGTDAPETHDLGSAASGGCGPRNGRGDPGFGATWGSGHRRLRRRRRSRSMAALFHQWRETHPPIRGIVHAAGTHSPETAGEIDSYNLARVLRPKVAGTCVLHDLTADLALDFFVLFSSVASVLGAKEPHYAAANRFLDAYANAARRGRQARLERQLGAVGRRRDGRHIGAGGAFRLVGIDSLPPDTAFAALDRLVGSGSSQAVVADVHWATLKLLDAQGRLGRLLEEIEDPTLPDSGRDASRPADDLLFGDTPEHHRREQLVRYFRERIAGVLRLAPSGSTPSGR